MADELAHYVEKVGDTQQLRNLTISFLSSNNVIDFFAMFTMQEPV